MLTTPSAIVAGDIQKVRSDLDDALGFVRSAAVAANTVAQLGAVVYGMEAMLRAVSTLTLVVEREQKDLAVLRGRINGVELGS